MFSRVYTGSVLGVKAVCVEVEVDIASRGLPSFSVVGLAEASVKESKERVRSSLKSINYNIFDKPITVNLAPAYFVKSGTHYDVPMSVGLVASANEDLFDKNLLEKTLLMGELSLDGKLRGINGALSVAIYGAENGFENIIVPWENRDEAALVPNISVYPFETITEVFSFLSGEVESTPFRIDLASLFLQNSFHEYNFSEVKGQTYAKKAVEIAACGMHNILFIGPPGSGKTMIAKRIPGILPDMVFEEALETTAIYSIAGRVVGGDFISQRPFVSPHHTSSNIALVGGGAKALPGNISLAHNGVLFLDEILEFSRSALEVLRQPMEDKYVTISRAGRTVSYPADFMLVGSANPCPCGFLGDSSRECSCSHLHVSKYREKLSGPLLDRIDMHVHVAPLVYSEMSNVMGEETSEKIKERITAAHKIQQQRHKGKGYIFNNQMSEKDLHIYCRLDDKGDALIGKAVDKYGLSARSYAKVLKISRTIADLENSEDIQSSHLLKALQYRVLEAGGV